MKLKSKKGLTLMSVSYTVFCIIPRGLFSVTGKFRNFFPYLGRESLNSFCMEAAREVEMIEIQNCSSFNICALYSAFAIRVFGPLHSW